MPLVPGRHLGDAASQRRQRHIGDDRSSIVRLATRYIK
jgi:hypothetical protein